MEPLSHKHCREHNTRKLFCQCMVIFPLFFKQHIPEEVFQSVGDISDAQHQ